MRVGAVRVEEGHLARLGADRAELLAGAEGAVDHGAVVGALELGANERPALAGLDVLELDDLEDRPVHLDVGAVLELVGPDHVRSERLACGRTRAMRGPERQTSIYVAGVSGRRPRVPTDATLLEERAREAMSARGVRVRRGRRRDGSHDAGEPRRLRSLAHRPADAARRVAARHQRRALRPHASRSRSSSRRSGCSRWRTARPSAP